MRGEAFEDMSFFDFVIGTYERPARDLPARWKPDVHVHYRSGYKPTKHRVRRPPNHEQLPRIGGHWFPPNNEPKRYEFYAASMLMLLKPWRTLDSLRDGDKTFASAFRTFVQHTTRQNLRILDVIQAYHDCARDAHVQDPYAATSTGLWETSTGGDPFGGHGDADDDGDESMEEDMRRELDAGLPDPATHVNTRPISEAMIQAAAERSIKPHLRVFASEAILIGENRGLFGPHPHEPGFDVQPTEGIAPISPAGFQVLVAHWSHDLRKSLADAGSSFYEEVQPSSSVVPSSLTHASPPAILPGSCLADNNRHGDAFSFASTSGVNARPVYYSLNGDQRRAHDMVVHHMLNRLYGQWFFSVHCLW